MENFSEKPEIINRQSFPVTINIPQYVRDHTFIGKTVIPAVDLCSILYVDVKNLFPEFDNLVMYNAVFGKFIEVGDSDNIDASIQIENYDNGTGTAKLLTKTKSGSAGITRIKEHVSIDFRKNKSAFNELTMDAASALEGICTRVPSALIYKELVPFGPYYHNIIDELFVSESGAVAHIKTPDVETNSPLGSPFLFDAAFHAACVWAQVNTGITVFPVEFKRRIIINPSIPGENYYARIIPKSQELPATVIAPATPAPDSRLAPDRGKIRISRSGAPAAASAGAPPDAFAAPPPPVYSVHASAAAGDAADPAPAADAADATGAGGADGGGSAAQARFYHGNPREDLGATWPPPSGGVAVDMSPKSARPLAKRISFRQPPKQPIDLLVSGPGVWNSRR